MLLCALLLASQSYADLVISNATLWSNGKMTPNAFIAVKGGRISYVGKPDRWMAGPTTEKVDARGRVVLPGLIDAHAHLLGGGVELTQLDLNGTKTKADFLRRIAVWVERTEPGKWVIGNGWSAESWPEKVQPTKEWLDEISSETPMALYRMDGHSLLVNSAALRLMNITKDGPGNPAGGSIDRDAKGEPTGLLRETAMSLAAKAIPQPTDEETYQGLKAAVKMANSNGITAVSEINSASGLPHFRRYASDGPTLRMGVYLTAGNWTSDIQAAKGFQKTQWVSVQGLKAYMDGSLGSRTAWMLAPYTKPLADQTSLTGLPRPGVTNGTYAKGIRDAAAANLQVIVHAIGDRANREVLNLFQKNAPNLAKLRFRVEHVQHTSKQDIRRFAQLGVIPSMQPYHKADDGRYCEVVIGTARSRSSYAYRQLLDSGARLAFGSDWSVVTINPFVGIEAAVTGRIMTGKVWMPHQNITVHEALKGYTVNAAYAMKMEKDIGQVAPGFRADLILLNASPFAKNPNWKQMGPTDMWVGGQRVNLTNRLSRANGSHLHAD